MRDYIITFLTAAALLGGYWIAGVVGLAVAGIVVSAVVGAGWMTALGRLDDLREEIEVGRSKRVLLAAENDTLWARIRFLQSRLSAPPEMLQIDTDDSDLVETEDDLNEEKTADPDRELSEL